MYINTTTSAYPVTERDIRDAHPNVSFPSPFVAPAGYAYVFPTPRPNHDPATQTVSEGVPELAELGHWQQTWVLQALAPETVAANLASAKAAKNLQINEWRDQANQSYFTHAGKQIACDSLSRSDIDAVAGSIALTGAFPAGFPGAWKAMDNSYIALADIDAFKAMYASMTLQGTINFGQSQTLKTALAAATTVAQVHALEWS